MTSQDDLLSSLTRGFPKGSKLNKTVPISQEAMENIHNRLREVVEERGYNYHDIINELKIIDDGGFALIKVALHRNALIVSVESEEKKSAQKLMNDLEKTISEL